MKSVVLTNLKTKQVQLDSVKLSIIIPCYNEDITLKPLLREIFKVKFPIDFEIIVVDDGSYNNHKFLILEEINSGKVKFIRLKQNQGKGFAIRVGLKYATGDIFIVRDAYLGYLPRDIPKLLTPILKNRTEVVYGTRFLKKPKGMSKSHYMANRFLTLFTRILYKCNITDVETGYKIFTKKALDKIKLNCREFEFEPEITSKFLSKGFKILDVPIVYQYRNHGTSKINWLDGFESLMILIRYRHLPYSLYYQYICKIYKHHVKKVLFKLIDYFKKKFCLDKVF